MYKRQHEEYEPTDKHIGHLGLFVLIVGLLATCPEVDRIRKETTDPGRIAWLTGRSPLGFYTGSESMCGRSWEIFQFKRDQRQHLRLMMHAGTCILCAVYLPAAVGPNAQKKDEGLRIIPVV